MSNWQRWIVDLMIFFAGGLGIRFFKNPRKHEPGTGTTVAPSCGSLGSMYHVPDEYAQLPCQTMVSNYVFFRKRSEGFPFIVGGLGVGPVFASCFSCRRGVVVASSSSTRYNSLPSGKALGNVFCGLLLLRPKTLIALSRLCKMAPTRVFSARPRRFCGRRNRFASSRSFMLRVFCESHCQRCAQCYKVQIPWQAWHFVTCDENRRTPRTKRRF